MAEAAIQVRDLTVERGGRVVLDRVSCSVPRGSIVGLLGPSGSGKSTLMRSIVGVQKVRSGEVTVLGRPAGSAELRSRVGYKTQAASVYLDLTVRENARYFSVLHGGGAHEAERAIAYVGLEDAAHQLARTLSGGQLARASLACTLLGDPEVLILDEPTVGQDPVLRNELWQHFHDLAAGGATLLVSSHVMDEARRCDRILLISEGAIIADDTPHAVTDRAGAEDMDEAFLRLVLARPSTGSGPSTGFHENDS
jgi:ABC-2 type transport system ATP-binding protein